MEEEENSESEKTVVEKPTEPDSAKLQNMGPDLNLENPSNKHAKVVGAKTSNDSEKQPSSINNEGKVQNPTTEGVSGKFSPKSRQIAAEETAEIEKQQQNNASWEDLEGEEVEEANEPEEPVIKFKKHVPIPKSAKGQLIAKCPFGRDVHVVLVSLLANQLSGQFLIFFVRPKNNCPVSDTRQFIFCPLH